MSDRGTRVTCLDLSSGETDSVDITDNHVVIVDGRAFVSSVVAYANGTHVITIKRAETVAEAQSHTTSMTRHFGEAAFR